MTRPDGSYLVSGWMPVDEFADLLSLEIDEDRDFQTVAGLVLHHLASLPTVGQCIEVQSWSLEVVDMDGRRIDKLLVQRAGRCGPLDPDRGPINQTAYRRGERRPHRAGANGAPMPQP